MITFKQFLAEKTERPFTGTSGFYCSMLLSSASVTRIASLCDRIGYPFTQKDEIHCTVMYSPEHVPSSIPVPPKMPIKGQIVRFELFGEEKDHLVALVESAELKALNKKLVDAGAVSTYPEYRPHVTVAKIPSDKKQEVTAKFMPIDIEFVSITIEDIKRD